MKNSKMAVKMKWYGLQVTWLKVFNLFKTGKFKLQCLILKLKSDFLSKIT